MKRITITAAGMVLALNACDTMNQPIRNGNFDPLSPPGSGISNLTTAGSEFTAGQFVSAIMDNTAFFNQRPKGNADADKLLTRGTSMKVISSDESYVRVELDSGEVGWVPSIMVENPASAATGAPFEAGNPGEYQVYPPVDPYGGMLPPSTPAEPPPGGTIPTVIDPEAGATVEPAPLPDNTPAPLPPNGLEE